MNLHLLTSTNLRLTKTPLAFEAQNKERIDVFWQQLVDVSPRLWNGIFYMFSKVNVKDGVLHGDAHRTDFATFLFWRDQKRDVDVSHITGTTLPILNDGSLLAVRMSRHTANPGKIYFPAGSFDQADINDDAFDVVGNFSREMDEEVGIAVSSDWLDGPFIAAETNGEFHVAQAMHLPMNFSSAERIWHKHRRDTGDDEIDALLNIAHNDHLPETMPAYARLLAEFHFSR